MPSGCAQNVVGEQKRVISTRVGAHGRLPGGVTKTEDEKEIGQIRKASETGDSAPRFPLGPAEP